MAPAANTAKTRKAKGMAADPDSDSDGYQGRLEQAEAARARLRKATEERNKKRKALAVAYHRSLAAIQDRVRKSTAQYRGLHTAIHMRRFERLKKAFDTRDAKLHAIVGKLVDVQQVMLNYGTQLRALYQGRRKDVAELFPVATKTESCGGVSERELGT